MPPLLAWYQSSARVIFATFRVLRRFGKTVSHPFSGGEGLFSLDPLPKTASYTKEIIPQ